MNDEKSRWDKLLARFPGRAVAYALILISVLAVLFKVGRDDIARDDYSLNLYTELLGVIVSVVITVFVIDELNRRRDDRRRNEELAKRLLRDARSPEPTIARNAFHQMKDLGLVDGEDSILKGGNLTRSRPIKIDLTAVRMEGASLDLADFSESTFTLSYLVGATLRDADLTHSKITYASLQNADLEGAKLTHASLIGANMRGANLLNANVDHAHSFLFTIESGSESNAEPNLTEIEQLTLPDGSRASRDTDMARFTDANHPDFWRSEDPASPAYRDRFERRLAMNRAIKRIMDKYPWKSGTAATPTGPT